MWGKETAFDMEEPDAEMIACFVATADRATNDPTALLHCTGELR